MQVEKFFLELYIVSVCTDTVQFTSIHIKCAKKKNLVVPRGQPGGGSMVIKWVVHKNTESVLSPWPKVGGLSMAYSFSSITFFIIQLGMSTYENWKQSIGASMYTLKNPKHIAHDLTMLTQHFVPHL